MPLERWDWEPLYSPAITPGAQHDSHDEYAYIDMLLHSFIQSL